jgi:hypothetical protein
MSVALGLGLALSLAAACDGRNTGAGRAARAWATAPGPSAATSASVAVELRVPSWPTYPCTQCHEHAPGTANPTERELRTFHTARNELAHGSFTGWCYRCHLRDNVDLLALADGRAVPFAQSHEQCGSCHGEKARDWRDGIHGRTVGYWRGARERRTCVSCHDPHRPAVGAMVAGPPPARPRTEAAKSPGAS